MIIVMECFLVHLDGQKVLRELLWRVLIIVVVNMVAGGKINVMLFDGIWSKIDKQTMVFVELLLTLKIYKYIYFRG